MADTDWNDFADASTMEPTDILLVWRAGGGLNIPGSAIVRQFAGGATISGTAVAAANGVISAPTLGTRGTTAGLFVTNSVQTYGLLGGVSGSGNSWLQAQRVDNDPTAYNLDLQPSGGDVRFGSPGSSLRPMADNAISLGLGAFRMSVVYAGTGSISTSDKRDKQQIGVIQDAWLDAWGQVEWCRFKFNDAVAEKGSDDARWHFGLIAQDVRDLLAAQDIDGRAWGLLCFDEWDEETEAVTHEVAKVRQVATQVLQPAGDVDGQPVFRPVIQMVDEAYTEEEPTGETRVVRAAGDRWGIRYDLAQAIEAAWQRRRADRLEAAIGALVERVGVLEAV